VKAVNALRVAVMGGGWAGLAAAVQATRIGHQVTLFEAARQLGGRARAVPTPLPDGSSITLDNGQHILIGAYTATLDLMRTVGVAPEQHLLRLPLTLQFPDGQGLCLPDWPVPLDVAAGVWRAQGWSLADKWSLLRSAARWQLAGFTCTPELSVAELCAGVSARVMHTLIEPLCVSALNTPADRASAQVFLRVLRDSLMGGKGSSNLLIPTSDLSTLLPHAAQAWLEQHRAQVRLGQRATLEQGTHAPAPNASKSTGPSEPPPWLVNGEPFDAVVCATSSSAAFQLLTGLQDGSDSVRQWIEQADALAFEAIATVYVQAGSTRLPHPMLALHSTPDFPAQFVFDRGQLGGPAGLLALVVSASGTERDALQEQVLRQARTQLAPWLGNAEVHALQTIVEKRATFACTPGLQRPPQAIAPGLLAAGDYIEGPYPATLEGAVRSGLAAAQTIGTAMQTP